MSLQKFDELSALVGLAKSEHGKFSSGTKVSATRCRQHLQSIVKICAELRKSVLDESKAMAKPKAAPAVDENLPPVESVEPPPKIERQAADPPVPESKNEQSGVAIKKAIPARPRARSRVKPGAK